MLPCCIRPKTVVDRGAYTFLSLRPWLSSFPSPPPTDLGAEEEQPDSAADQQHGRHRWQQDDEPPPTVKHDDLQPSSFPPQADNNTRVRFRGHYDLARTVKGGGARSGPLSVNDPQLDATDLAMKLLRSENFLSLACPIGAGSSWRIKYRDAEVLVHLLLRAMMAAQDFAGAARALATLHRALGRFDPDVYRYTVALLRLSGDHQVSRVPRREICPSTDGGCCRPVASLFFVSMEFRFDTGVPISL